MSTRRVCDKCQVDIAFSILTAQGQTTSSVARGPFKLETADSGRFPLDFCSVRCLRKWAKDAETRTGLS